MFGSGTSFMNVQPAPWEDVVRALELEAAELGDDAAWDLGRVKEWFDAGVVTALSIRENDRMVSYVSAVHLADGVFDAIVSGELDPERLELSHAVTQSDHHWIGIVITDPSQRGRGAASTVVQKMMSVCPGTFVADVYSTGGRAVFEKLGWARVREADHPYLHLPQEVTRLLDCCRRVAPGRGLQDRHLTATVNRLCGSVTMVLSTLSALSTKQCPCARIAPGALSCT